MNPAFRAREIVIGQYAGIALLFSLSLLASLLALAIPRAYIGAAGLFPIFLGLKGLWEGRKAAAEQGKASPIADSGKWGRTMMVALLTLTNGGDNLSIYVPVFALHSRLELLVIGVTFAFLTGSWCYVAHRVVHHPPFGKSGEEVWVAPRSVPSNRHRRVDPLGGRDHTPAH